MLTVKSFSLGPLETNSFLLEDTQAKQTLVVDAPGEPRELLQALKTWGGTPDLLVLTHGHFDHIAGIPELKKAYPGLKVGIHPLEKDFLTDPMKNLSGLWTQPVSVGEPDFFLEEGNTFTLGRYKFLVWHVPGHSPGSLVFYQPEEKILMAGDVLFRGSVGRTDFPGSDPKALRTGLQRLLRDLPGETRVYSGHGPETTLHREKTSNPYLEGL